MSRCIKAQKKFFILFAMGLTPCLLGNIAQETQPLDGEQEPIFLSEVLKFFADLREETWRTLQEQASGEQTPTRENKIRIGGRGKLGVNQPGRADGSAEQPKFLQASVTPIEDELSRWVAILILNSHDLDCHDPIKRTNEQIRFGILKDDAALYFLHLGLLGLEIESKHHMAKQKAPAQAKPHEHHAETTSVRPQPSKTPSTPPGLKHSESCPSFSRFNG